MDYSCSSGCVQFISCYNQRKRDDNKNKICTFQGGLGRGAGRKIVQNAFFMGNVMTKKI